MEYDGVGWLVLGLELCSMSRMALGDLIAYARTGFVGATVSLATFSVGSLLVIARYGTFEVFSSVQKGIEEVEKDHTNDCVLYEGRSHELRRSYVIETKYAKLRLTRASIVLAAWVEKAKLEDVRELIKLDISGNGIATVTLNRPKSMNSLSSAMIDTSPMLSHHCQTDLTAAKSVF
ncbi:hypothetical protein R1flu_001047 [Riccia fluitans]|uniref:ATP synthase protein MI25 n=1 Tax=Riccia fluitans TaxID=41844 RepID=A0ABD1Y544_9MARC